MLRHADGPVDELRPPRPRLGRRALRVRPPAAGRRHPGRQRNAYLVEPLPPGGRGGHHRGLAGALPGPAGGSRRARRATRRPDGRGDGVRGPRPPRGGPGRPGDQGGPSGRPCARCATRCSTSPNANVVDLGYVYDLRLRGETVQAVMTMPQRGRPRYLFVGQHMKRRLEATPGVPPRRDCHLTWDLPWMLHRMSDAGLRAMRLDADENPGPERPGSRCLELTRAGSDPMVGLAAAAGGARWCGEGLSQ